MVIGTCSGNALILHLCAGSDLSRDRFKRVRDFAFLPGPPPLWDGVLYVIFFVVASVGSLYWPSEVRDLGVGEEREEGSYFGLDILYELWAGERLVCEKAVPESCRNGRSISV